MKWDYIHETGPRRGLPAYQYGRETYHLIDGEICRTFARHPGTQVHRNSQWIWK